MLPQDARYVVGINFLLFTSSPKNENFYGDYLSLPYYTVIHKKIFDNVLPFQ